MGPPCVRTDVAYKILRYNHTKIQRFKMRAQPCRQYTAEYKEEIVKRPIYFDLQQSFLLKEFDL